MQAFYDFVFGKRMANRGLLGLDRQKPAEGGTTVEILLPLRFQGEENGRG